MKEKNQKRLTDKGVTLVELLAAMAIVGVVTAGIYSVYYSQQKSYVAQEQIAAMQQNLRAAMYIMEREIRMAGYDPTRDAGASITIADVAELEFTKDDNPSDGNLDDPNEQIRYALTDDDDGDGVADGIPCELGRETGGAGGLQMVAENIDALDFVYLDGAGDPLATPVANLGDIRSIQITLVARTGRGDPGYINSTAYYNQQDLVNPTLPAQNDNVRRKRLTAQIKCRNLGL